MFLAKFTSMPAAFVAVAAIGLTTGGVFYQTQAQSDGPAQPREKKVSAQSEPKREQPNQRPDTDRRERDLFESLKRATAKELELSEQLDSSRRELSVLRQELERAQAELHNSQRLSRDERMFQLQLEMKKLLTSHGPKHPEVLQIDQQIKALNDFYRASNQPTSDEKNLEKIREQRSELSKELKHLEEQERQVQLKVEIARRCNARQGQDNVVAGQQKPEVQPQPDRLDQLMQRLERIEKRMEQLEQNRRE